MRRCSAVLTAILVAGLALAPSMADARAGSGSSMGSRGARTYTAPPPTTTSPFSAAPMDRSMTARPAPAAPFGAPNPMQVPARSGFGSALLGGLLGVGLGSMFFGHGYGFGGGFGFIGLLLQLALLFFVGRWLFRMVFGRSQPLMAGMGRLGQPAPQMMGGGGGMPGAAAGQPIQIAPGDYQAFERLLQDVQGAWSAQDMRALQQLSTPEMVSYFGEQLAEQASRGVRNSVTDVRLEKGDLAEAWSEGSREYATVAMRFSMIDVTRDSSGRIVDGALAERVLVTELWTFVRAPGGRWLLSAIQQGR
jgi:predicted lipid-binding transport protein (Tim44 family)